MAGMSVDGLVSGLDTTSLINQLLQAEAGQQNQLKSRLAATQNAASAFRTVNSSFAAVRAAAEAVLKPEAWTPTKATSSATDRVSVAATPSATTGSLTFTVDSLATSHAVVNRNAAWTSTTSAYGAAEIEVFDGNGVARTPAIKVGGTGTLADAAAAVNASGHGLSAAVVQVRDGATPEYALQITARTTGLESKFSLGGAGTFGVTKEAANAELTVGDLPGQYKITSNSNTFSNVLPGATFTVLTASTTAPVTITVANDPEAVATKVQGLVDAVNAALSTVRTYTNNTPGSTAALKGDYAVTQLSGQLLDAVASAVGSDGSPARAGFTLSRDGRVEFNKSTFLTALKDTPELAQRMVFGQAARDPDGTAGNGDELPAVTGLAQRLLDVAKRASDASTGSLVKLADGQDSLVKDLRHRIDAWDDRLAKRREALTRQFSAMETALSSLRNQSTWLAGQLNSLPSS